MFIGAKALPKHDEPMHDAASRREPLQLFPWQLLPWQLVPALRPLQDPLQLLPRQPPPKLKNEMIRPLNSPLPPQQPLQLLPWHLEPSDCERVSDWQPLPPAKSRKNPLKCVDSGAVVRAVIITSVYIGVSSAVGLRKSAHWVVCADIAGKVSARNRRVKGT